jgi:16S rRNA (guanine966-N2)-methyltransferase
LQRGWLAPDALLYIENELPLGTPELPENWRLLRSKKAGQVAYHLVTNGQ